MPDDAPKPLTEDLRASQEQHLAFLKTSLDLRESQLIKREENLNKKESLLKTRFRELQQKEYELKHKSDIIK